MKGTKNYSPSARSYIEKNGGKDVVSFLVCRAPVNSMITGALNLISLGKFEEAQAEKGYDKFYHLSLVGTYADGKKFLIEKLSQVNIKACAGPPANSETMAAGSFAPVKLGVLLDKARKATGDQGWFEYSAFDNNCQKFVASVLNACGGYTAAVKAFAYQDVKDLLKKQPAWVDKVARTATDLKSIAERVINGAGLRHRGLVRKVLLDVM